jgi:CheY-like chemotaxis protein
MERMLQSYNPDLEIVSGYSGRAGLSLAASRKPDVVFLDLSMPDVDGFYVIDQMKAAPDLAGIPVVLLTANLHPERMITWADNRVLIQRRGELRVAETVDLLKAALAVIRPDYSETTDDILTKIRL